MLPQFFLMLITTEYTRNLRKLFFCTFNINLDSVKIRNSAILNENKNLISFILDDKN